MSKELWRPLTFAQMSTFVARFMALVFFAGEMKSFGVIINPVVSQSKLSYRSLGLVFTWFYGVSSIVTPLMSLLVQSKYRSVWLVTAGFLVGLGFMGLTFCLNIGVWAMLCAMSLSGIGNSLMDLLSILCLKDSFGVCFPTAYALSNLGTTIGIAVLPLILEYFQRQYNLKEALFLFGTLLWNNVVIAFLLKPRLAQRTSDFIEDENESNAAARDCQTQKMCTLASLFEVFVCHKWFIIIYLITILEELHFTGWALYLVPYGESAGMTSQTAVFLSTIGGISGVFGKLLATLSAYFKFLNPFPVLVVPSILVAAAYMITFYWNSFLSFAIMSFVSGFVVGFQESINFCLIDSFVCDFHFNNALSWILTSNALTVVMGGVLPGCLIDITGNFQYVFIFLSGVYLLKGFIAIALCFNKSPSDGIRTCKLE